MRRFSRKNLQITSDQKIDHIFKVSYQKIVFSISQIKLSRLTYDHTSLHFGGLHEAAVKSAKHHLRKMTANTKFTFDEFYSLNKQIEATLNSTNDPIDILTPGHFLIRSDMMPQFLH